MATKKKKPARKAKAKGKAKKPVKRAKRAVQAKRAVRAKQIADPLHESPASSELADTAPKDEVWEIFRRYDRDGNGFIDRGELARLCEALGMAIAEDELLIAFDVVDANHSGKISWDEFSAWWRSR